MSSSPCFRAGSSAPYAPCGRVERSPYHNVLGMTVDNPLGLLEAIERRSADDPALYDAISRVAPASRCFDFTTASEFCEQSEAIALEWLPGLAYRSFHVRVHGRGLGRYLHSTNAASADRASSASVKYWQKLLLPTAEPPITKNRTQTALENVGCGSLPLGRHVELAPWIGGQGLASCYRDLTRRSATTATNTSCETAPPHGLCYTAGCTI